MKEEMLENAHRTRSDLRKADQNVLLQQIRLIFETTPFVKILVFSS